MAVSKTMIVKIQISTNDSLGRSRALIYNEDRSVFHEVEPTKEILKLMKGSKKEFFECEINDEGLIGIIGKAKWKSW